MDKMRIGLLGLGQIGSGLYTILNRKKSYFKKEIDVELEIAKIAVRSKGKKRKVKVPSKLLVTNAMSIVRDPSIDVVVELIGGTTDAFDYVAEALRCGKHVVTANKALLAEKGDALFKLACEKKRWIFFEASVGGGIPVIKSLRQGMVANQIESIEAIINGTSNYILSKMSEEGLDYKEALKGAQDKGYAEADPTLDLDGTDAAHKLAILVRFAFGGRVKFSSIYSEGITHIRKEDINFAEEFGYRIKLLAIAKRLGKGIEARVQPMLIAKDHILANVRGSHNAVLMRGDEVGDVLLYGRGAGPHPTASAVISDLVDIAKKQSITLDLDQSVMRSNSRPLTIQNVSSLQSRFYLRFHVVDRPGVLAKITKILGQHKVSISDCFQKERNVGNVVPLIMLTHDVHEEAVTKAVREIGKLNSIKGKAQVIRIKD